MLTNLRLAFRQFRKTPGFTAVAILTLALGIGANTAIFSVVDTLLLKPLPYPDADRIVQISGRPPNGGSAVSSGGIFIDWQDHSTQLEHIAAQHPSNMNLTGEGEPVRLTGAEVTADFFRVLRVNPILGRDFTAQDDAPGGNRHVIILTNELWQSVFHGDPAVLGQSVRLDGQSFQVIGILPPHALTASNATYFVPASIRSESWKQVRDYNYVVNVIGRLKPGATIEQVAAELNAAKRALNASYPSFMANWTVDVQTLQTALFGGSQYGALTLVIATGLVLLIACANVANLLLARSASRQGEIAVRVAMGATTGRIVRQLLAESLLLAFAGGIAGVILGSWLINPLAAFTGMTAAGLTAVIDGRVLGFSLVVAGATGLLFGLFPALTAARPDLVETLKEGARGTSGGARRRMQSLLVVAETALTVVLLVSAGLLLRSFVKAMGADTGFARDHVLVFTLNQPGTKAPTNGHRVRFTREILDRLAQVPGVAKVGMASSTPMNGNAYYGDFVSREDQPETRNDLNAGFDSAGGNFFAAMGIPLLRGRIFTDADNAENAPRVMIINDNLAQRLFGDKDPIGQLLHFKGETWQVVGVVGSARRYALDTGPTPQLYYPQIYFPWRTEYVVRTHVPPQTLASDIRRAVHAVDPEAPVSDLRTLDIAVESTLRSRQIMLTLLAIFAGTALLLACVGIYGVMSYAVAQRTRELGIRIALGAGARGVVTLVLKEALTLVVVGLGIGAVASLGAGRLIASQLYQASYSDPVVVFTLVAGSLLASAAIACWFPAHRATRIDPITALRAE